MIINQFVNATELDTNLFNMANLIREKTNKDTSLSFPNGFINSLSLFKSHDFVYGTITPSSNLRSLTLTDFIGKNCYVIHPITDIDNSAITTRIHYGGLFLGGRSIFCESNNSGKNGWTNISTTAYGTGNASAHTFNSDTGKITIVKGADTNGGGYFLSGITYAYAAWIEDTEIWNNQTKKIINSITELKSVNSTKLNQDITLLKNGLNQLNDTNNTLTFPTDFISSINNISSQNNNIVSGTFTPTSNITNITLPQLIGKNSFIFYPAVNLPSTLSVIGHIGGIYYNNRSILSVGRKSGDTTQGFKSTWSLGTGNNGGYSFNSSTGKITLNIGTGTYSGGGYLLNGVRYYYAGWTVTES